MSYNYPYAYGPAFNAGPFHHHDLARSNASQTYQPSPTFYPFNNDYPPFDYPMSDSPDSLDSASSLPEESMYATYASDFPSHLSPPPITGRSNTYPPSSQRHGNSAVRPAETHTIHRNENEMDDFIRERVHKLNELEKRSLNFSPSRERPNFCCRIPGCMQPYIYNKAQVKEHLVVQHNVVFRKPWGCSCGSQFGRQVEADRHLEDQKPCSICGLPGRKLKGFGGMICHRCQKKGVNKRPLVSSQ